MHACALTLVALAGVVFCGAGYRRWRGLARRESGAWGTVASAWVGLALLTSGLVCSYIDNEHIVFRFGVLTSWSAIVAIVFINRYLALPSRGLLVLPVGGMALLVALTGLTPPDPAAAAVERDLVLKTHISIMVFHLAAMLIAGGAGTLYLIAGRKLKTSVTAALQLPKLPVLERLCERSLVVATALLIGGLVTGGVAMRNSDRFTVTSLPVVIGMVSMAVLVVILALRLAGRLTRSRLAWSALIALVLAALSIISVVAGHYVE